MYFYGGRVTGCLRIFFNGRNYVTHIFSVVDPRNPICYLLTLVGRADLGIRVERRKPSWLPWELNEEPLDPDVRNLLLVLGLLCVIQGVVEQEKCQVLFKLHLIFFSL